MYGTNLDQVGPKKANLDQVGQVGRRFAVFCLLRKAPLTNLDQVGPALFPTVQCHAEGGATKGGVSKCEQTQTNADKRKQTQANAEAKTQANASKRRGKNASKRKQTWTNANKRKQTLTPPFIAVFLHPPLQSP